MQLRPRTLSPTHAKDYRLYTAESETGLPLRATYLMLHLVCDRNGRFRWSLRDLKPQIAPYDPAEIFERSMLALARFGLIATYAVGDVRCGLVNDFMTTQNINGREVPGDLPGPDAPGATSFVPRVQVKPDGLVPSTVPEKPAESPAQPVATDELPLFSGKPEVVPEELDLFGEGGFRFMKMGQQWLRQEKDGRRVLVAGKSDTTEAITYIEVVGEPAFPELGVSRGYLEHTYRPAFPHLDLERHLHEAALWCHTNATRRKTRTGIPSYLLTWFKTEQNKGSGAQGGRGTFVAREDRSDANRRVARDYLERHQQGQGGLAPSGEKDITGDGVEVIRPSMPPVQGSGLRKTFNAAMADAREL